MQENDVLFTNPRLTTRNETENATSEEEKAEFKKTQMDIRIKSREWVAWLSYKRAYGHWRDWWHALNMLRQSESADTAAMHEQYTHRMKDAYQQAEEAIESILKPDARSWPDGWLIWYVARCHYVRYRLTFSSS